MDLNGISIVPTADRVGVAIVDSNFERLEICVAVRGNRLQINLYDREGTDAFQCIDIDVSKLKTI